jgi:hypothetical protein
MYVITNVRHHEFASVVARSLRYRLKRKSSLNREEPHSYRFDFEPLDTIAVSEAAEGVRAKRHVASGSATDRGYPCGFADELNG